MLRDVLARIGAEYERARNESTNSHPLAAFIRDDATKLIGAIIADSNLMVEGSAGKGNWASIPWIAVFDPRATDSATRGYYAVFLFDAQMQSVALSMNQGTTAVRDEFGAGAIDELRRRAALIRARVPEFKDRFSAEPIDLKSSQRLPAAYAAGHSFGAVYQIRSLPPEEVLVADLRDLVDLYLKLVARGGIDTLQEIPSDETEASITEITERRKYRLHLKLDRNPKASKAAKAALGYTCQGCGFDFAKAYGSIGERFIEAHHLKPLGEIPEGQTITMNPATDFAVLCSNCHSMMHRTDGPRSLDDLRNLPALARLRAFLTDGQ